MSESNLLVEKRAELAAKTKKFQEVMDASTTEGGATDLSRAPVLEKLGAADASDAKGKVASLYAEIESLNHDVDELHLAEMKRGVSRIGDDLKRPIRQTIPGTALTDEPRSFGQLAVDAKGFMQGVRDKVYPTRAEVDIGIKTLMQTSAGWQPRTGNGDRVVDFIIRPVQVLDFIPSDTTELFEYPFMKETTRTQAAAELAEAGTYAEDAFAYTRAVSPVRKIGSQIPVTDEQLADEGSVRALIDNRLRFGLLARLDQQVLVGDGTSPNLSGVNDAASIQIQAKGADPHANAFFKAMTKVRITGRAAPDLIVMHGNDWQDIRLSQNAQGDYQFGPPSAVGQDTLWGLPVVQSEALTEGTALVGSFRQYSLLLYRKGIEVMTGYIASQFIEGKVTLRADLRAAFVVFRDEAFCRVTGL